MFARRIPLAVLLVLAPACLDAEETGSGERALADGTPDGVGLLALLNDASTTLEVLDDEVPLDARAARNLIDHRNGPDGVFGTADDDRFDTVAEVDDVSWVGEVGLARLVAFAAAQGFVPEAGDHLGDFEGVPFTVAEAERALRAANEYSDGVLRYEVPLDVRAVRGIIDARPIRSMIELADAYYVGPAMMQRLKDYVAEPAPGERADCRGNWDCPGPDSYCTGIPHDGSSEYGKCYEQVWPDGANASCSAERPCKDGLVCLGEIAWGSGFCVPEWQRGTFENQVQRYIPQDGSAVTTGVVVRGLATVPVDIAVHLDLRHSDPDSLRITLRTFRGYESVMWDGPNETGELPDVLTRNCCIPSDDSVNGRWWLVIENVEGKGLGSLHGWTLEIVSQWD